MGAVMMTSDQTALSDAPSCRILEWDSDFFGIAVGRVNAECLDEVTAGAIEEWIRSHAPDCLYLLADSTHGATQATAARLGFVFIDQRVVFERDFSMAPVNGAAADDGIRHAASEDRAALIEISRVISTASRFSRDPRFDRSAAPRLYERWILNSLGDANVEVLVADGEEGLVGFVTLAPDHGDADTDFLELVGVHPKASGRGWGRRLLAVAAKRAMARGRRHLKVVTQGSNIPAMRLYQSSGFRPCQARNWYHRWSGAKRG